MPTWPSAAAFARDMERLEADLARREALRITKQQAEEAQKIAYRTAEGDLGGDRKFSGWAPELDLRIRTTKRFGHSLLPTRQSAGPWTVAEFGRNQGTGGGGAFFGPGANRSTGTTRRRSDGSVAKVRSFRSKRWNGYTQGKQTASKALRQIEQSAETIADKEVKRVLKRRFDVT